MTVDALKDKIEEVISRKIRPVLRADNGDIALLDIASDGLA